MAYAGTVAAVLLAAQINLKLVLVLHNESRREEVHEQSAQTLEPCTTQQRGVFFSRPRHLLLWFLIDIPHCVDFRANPLQRRALAAAGPGHCCAQQHLVHRNGSNM